MDTNIVILFMLILAIGIGFIAFFLATKIQSSKAIAMQQKITDLEMQNNRYIAHNVELNEQNKQYAIEKSVAQSEVKNMKQQMLDWEKTKQEFVVSAKGASLEVSQNLMKDLLEQHQKQNLASTKETERRIENSTKQLHESYKNLFSSVNSLKDKLSENNDTVETIKNAISSSASVGYASETILENVLKSFGLQSDIDFFTQLSVDDGSGNRLRPDAVVMLPNDSALVIDSKASKFIYELADAEKDNDIDKIKLAKDNLAKSMNTHLKSLTNKDYSKAIMADMKKTGYDINTLNHISTIMWLPNDASVEKLNECDTTFTNRASVSNVFVCGPTALWTAIGIASQKIRLDKQNKNHIHIVEESEKLLGYIATVVEKGNKVEKGLVSANKSWNEFSKSFNSRLLSSAKRIEKLGVKPSKALNSLGTENIEDILEIETKENKAKKIT